MSGLAREAFWEHEKQCAKCDAIAPCDRHDLLAGSRAGHDRGAAFPDRPVFLIRDEKNGEPNRRGRRGLGWRSEILTGGAEKGSTMRSRRRKLILEAANLKKFL
jgi:hypothetical protein